MPAMTIQRLATAALIAASLGAAAHADTLSFSAAPMASTMTDWATFAELQQFNPALGTLQQVTLTLDAALSGSAAGENRNNTARTITLDLRATLALFSPDALGVVLVQTTPLVSQSFAAARYDGLQDYNGASGKSYGNLSASSSSQQSFNDGVTLAWFTGPGSVVLPFTAVGQSTGIGSGNMRSDFTAFAGGTASVTYLYAPAASLPPVPEPATWALLVAGLAAIGWKSSRRNA
jgi:hypothetical protein